MEQKENTNPYSQNKYFENNSLQKLDFGEKDYSYPEESTTISLGEHLIDHLT